MAAQRADVGMVKKKGGSHLSSLNTARTFGPYLIDSLLGGPDLWVYFPIYIIGPIIGAVIAAFFLRLSYRRRVRSGRTQEAINREID